MTIAEGKRVFQRARVQPGEGSNGEPNSDEDPLPRIGTEDQR